METALERQITSIAIVAISAITLPVYIVLIVIVAYRKFRNQKTFKSVYFAFFCSQGIADVISMVAYIFFVIAPQVDEFRFWFWNNRASALPAWTYLHTYVSLVARSCGVLFITFQRYSALVLTYSYLNLLLNSIPGFSYFLLHATLTLAIPLPIIIYQKGFEFASPNLELMTVIPGFQERMEITWRMFTWSMLAILLFGAYFVGSSILSVKSWAEFKGRAQLKNEKMILVQACCLLVTFASMTLFMIAVDVLILAGQVAQASYLESRYSIVNAFFSLSPPWYTLILNPKMRRVIFTRHRTRIMATINNPGSVAGMAKVG